MWRLRRAVAGIGVLLATACLVPEARAKLLERCPCVSRLSSRPWKDHAQYVRCVRRDTRRKLRYGVVTPERAAELIRTAELAPCGDPAARCGGREGRACPAGFLCDVGRMLACAETRGVCRPAPTECPSSLDLVCGCDEATYPNHCERLRAGAPPEHPGDCYEPARNPPPCGGAERVACPAYMYCYHVNGTCGEHGETGFCAWRPTRVEECDQTGLVHLRGFTGPYGFCGCDGRVYRDRCEAGVAGVSLRSPDGRDCAAP